MQALLVQDGKRFRQANRLVIFRKPRPLHQLIIEAIPLPGFHSVQTNHVPRRELSETPKIVRIKPRTAVARTWPVPASAVIRRVLEWVHRCARPAATKGSQWVGIAA